MPFLSRIRINPFRQKSRELLANPHKTHGAVLAGLPDPEVERPLWRWDTGRERRPYLLVLTHTVADWAHLVEQCGWPAADGDHVITRDYTPLIRQLGEGREFAFRVTANPVQNVPAPAQESTPEPSAKPGRAVRKGHRTAAHQQRWFLERAERWGFQVPPALLDDPEADDVPDMRITQRQRLSFAKRKGGKPVILTTATFEGRLRITDSELFTRTLLRGLGPAKAYGCGLLTLAPLPATARG
jgi:CRISPR system Cascade subunit CasE